MDRTEFMSRLTAEVERAYRKHGRLQWGRHEFYGVILEEVEEVIEAFRFRFLLLRQIRRIWNNIKHDKGQDELEKEIMQVAAMCLRYLESGDRYRRPAEQPSNIRIQYD